MGANNQKEKKKEEENNNEISSEENMEKSNKINFLKMKLRKTMKTRIEYFNTFPNGNILVYNKKKLTIYDQESFKIIFKYKIKDIDNIIILSNTNILLYEKENDYFSILDLSKNIKKIKIKLTEKFHEDSYYCYPFRGKYIYTYTNRYIYSKNRYISKNRYTPKNRCISLVKLNNTHILFYYLNKKYYYSFIFYIYDSKNSDLIFDYEDFQKFEIDLGKVLPYRDYSFFYFGGNSEYDRDYKITKISNFVYLYRNKQIESVYVYVYETENYDEFDDFDMNVLECFIFLNKFLIVRLNGNFSIYKIKEKGSELISKYSFNDWPYKIIQNKAHLLLIFDEEKDCWTVSELDKNYKIKEKGKFKGVHFTGVEEEFLFYKKRLYYFTKKYFYMIE